MQAGSRPVFYNPSNNGICISLEQKSLTAIYLEECAQQSVAAIRIWWLGFWDHTILPFSDSSKVMMTLLSAVYELLLERVESFQERLNASGDTSSYPTLVQWNLNNI